MIKFNCPHCEIQIEAESEHAGASANCPTCAGDLIVPTGTSCNPERPSVSENLSEVTKDAPDAPFPKSKSDANHSDLCEMTTQNPGASEETNLVGNLPKLSFGTRLASITNGVKLNSKIAALKTRIENAKQIELRKAHYALGRKLYESRIFLSMQDEIEALERQLSEKGEDAIIEENESKGAMLKRVGKNAAKSAESTLLSLKLKQSMTRLGKLARNSPQQISLAGTTAQEEAIYVVESKIQQLEKEVSSLEALRNKVNGTILPNDAAQYTKTVGLQDQATVSAEDSGCDPAIDHPECNEGMHSAIRVENPPLAASAAAPTQSVVAGFQSASKPERLTDNVLGSAFSLPRLTPLFVCCLLFGWVTGGFLLPERGFIINSFIGQAIPVVMLAVPSLILAIFGICFFVRPVRFPRKEAIGVLFFTMLVGLAGLFVFQWLAGLSLETHPRHTGSKAITIIWLIIYAIGGAYKSIESTSVVDQLFGFIFGVGICEETTKLLPLFLFAWNRENRPDRIDFRSFLVIAFFSGLGFGIGEALYCYAPWSSNPLVGTNVLRWFALVPSHAIWTVTDAAFLWLLAPKISQAKNLYAAFGYCALTVLTVAIVHGIYDVLCGIPVMGILFSAGSIFLMYFVVVWVAKKTNEAEIVQEHDEFISTGIVGWLKNHNAGQMRFGRIYMVSAAMIVCSLVFSSSGGYSAGTTGITSKDEIESEFSMSLDQGVYAGYCMLYEVGKMANRQVTNSDLQSMEYEMRQKHPELSKNAIRLILLGMSDGSSGRPNRLEGVDINSLPPGEPAR